MAGEIGVMFNIPQPFTVRTKRLSQVIRISHLHFKQMVQPLNDDGKTIIANFVQYLKELKKKEVLVEIPFLTELLGDFNIEHPSALEGLLNQEASNYGQEANTEGTPTTPTLSNTLPMRLVIHGHHPDDKTTEGDCTGKLIHLPESIEALLSLAEKKFGKRGDTILMADGSEVEDLNALRDNDKLYIF